MHVYDLEKKILMIQASHLRICRYHERIIEQFDKRPHAVQLKPLLFDESDVEVSEITLVKVDDFCFPEKGE